MCKCIDFGITSCVSCLLDSSTNVNNVVFGNASAPENLPEIKRITGEEEEENILQVSCLSVCYLRRLVICCTLNKEYNGYKRLGI